MAYLYSGTNNWGNPNREGIIITPPITDLALVFPFDKLSNKFDRNFYAPALTDGRASFETLDHFLQKVERILKKKARQVFIASLILAFVILVGFFMTLYSLAGGLDDLTQDDIDSDDPDTVFSAMFAFLFIAVISSLGFSAFVRCKDRKAQKRIKSFVEKNSQAFNVLGLRWSMPLRFPQWIELWKDYKSQSSAYLPPLMPQNSLSNNGNSTQGQMMRQQHNLQTFSNPQNYSSNQNQQVDTNINLQQPLIGQQRYPEFNQYNPLDA
jgi:hypothetical protein